VPDATRAVPGGVGDEPAWEPEKWVDEGELRDEATEAVGRGGTTEPAVRRPGRKRWTPNDDLAGDEDDDAGVGSGGAGHGDRESQTAEELRRAFGAQRAGRAEARLREASDDFRRERYEDARKLLRPLADQAPGAATVRELFGLTLYRLGRWAPARRELEAFRDLTGSVEQHPVLADCYRALGRYHEVEELWDELKAASPSGELVAEGRIVAAGALADQGRLEDAIELLQAGIHPTKRAKVHHLRMIYALADLYERAGDAPRARELFKRVATADPEFVDVEARIRALR
jgi:tetratricopeptide (TPR) repeat protein